MRTVPKPQKHEKVSKNSIFIRIIPDFINGISKISEKFKKKSDFPIFPEIIDTYTFFEAHKC
jgi:hypothetical protein